MSEIVRIAPRARALVVTETSSVSKTDLHDLAAPHCSGVDLFIHQPRFGRTAWVNGDGGVIPPAFRRVTAGIVEG